MGRILKSLGLQLPYEPGELDERALEVTDIGVAFDAAVVRAVQGDGTTIPAVYRSGQLIADTVASLHMEQFDEETQVVDAGVRPEVLRNPNPEETYHDFMNKVVYSLIFRGNAYLRPITRNKLGDITSVHVLDPDEVSVQWDRNRIYPIYSWRDRNMVRDKDIVHIPFNLYPGAVEGVGPITAARLMLAGAEAEQAFQKSIFEDNATPTGLIKVQGKTQDEVDAIAAGLEAKAAEGRRLPKVISNAEWEQITINPVDAQFLESREFTIQDIARLFGLQGFFLNVASGDSLTYSTTESLFRLFVTSTLRPTYLERIEQAFGRLLPRGKLARFNVDELLRADITGRYDSYEVGLKYGFLTINEVRQLEGLPPVPGGDIAQPIKVAQNGSGKIKELTNV